MTTWDVCGGAVIRVPWSWGGGAGGPDDQRQTEKW